MIAPILAVSKIARLMGVEFTPQSLGLSEPDHYHSPATAAARLDSLELKMVKPPSTKHEDGAADTQYNETNDGIMCAVCQCDFEEGEYGLVFRHCKHAFHAKCLNTWLDRRHTCPCCRESVSPDASSVKGRRRFDSVRYAFRSGEGRRGSAPAAAGAAPVSVMFGGGGSGEERRGRGRRDVETSPLEADGDVVEPSQEMEMEDVVDVASDVDDSLYEEAASGRFIFF